MKPICIIPARLESTRFPGKLLALAQGKTVLQRTWEQAMNCSAFSAVYVATDHEKIGSHIEQLGGNVLWTASHWKNGTERIIEALQKNPSLQRAKIVVNVQGDHPCTSPEAMQSVIKILGSDPSAVMSTAAIPLTDEKAFYSSQVPKCVFDGQKNALYFSRAPIPYSRTGVPKGAYHHIGLYAYRTSFLLSSLGHPLTPLQEQEDLEQLQILERGFKIKVALIQDPPIGVDAPEDLARLEAYLQMTQREWTALA
ncbi:MAG: 3-deoxy-manno-octulosonate cytidylyltransferase [Chlamydiae bacterium]|nr:3-deoxy-manno-octulosonate cytidylyltransferase [Chlamydiota bacterium]